MTQFISVGVAGIVCFISFGGRLPSPSSETDKGSISRGVSLDSTRKVIGSVGLKPSGSRAYASHPDGDKFLFYSLEVKRTELVVQYSPRTNQVTRLVLYALGDPRSKMSDVALDISSITFHRNGEYSIRFPAAQRLSKRQS